MQRAILGEGIGELGGAELEVLVVGGGCWEVVGLFERSGVDHG